jgi:hypothetical protein
MDVQNEKRKQIKWDEETIAEHDKERGTRQKIDEAPTPFHAVVGLSDLTTAQNDSLHEHAFDAAVGSLDSPAARGRSSSFTCESAQGSGVAQNWEALQARLIYEQSLGNTVNNESGGALHRLSFSFAI